MWHTGIFWSIYLITNIPGRVNSVVDLPGWKGGGAGEWSICRTPVRDGVRTLPPSPSSPPPPPRVDPIQVILKALFPVYPRVANKNHHTNAGLMLAHRLWRWASISPASGRHLVFMRWVDPGIKRPWFNALRRHQVWRLSTHAQYGTDSNQP